MDIAATVRLLLQRLAVAVSSEGQSMSRLGSVVPAFTVTCFPKIHMNHDVHQSQSNYFTSSAALYCYCCRAAPLLCLSRTCGVQRVPQGVHDEGERAEEDDEGDDADVEQ